MKIKVYTVSAFSSFEFNSKPRMQKMQLRFVGVGRIPMNAWKLSKGEYFLPPKDQNCISVVRRICGPGECFPNMRLFYFPSPFISCIASAPTSFFRLVSFSILPLSCNPRSRIPSCSSPRSLPPRRPPSSLSPCGRGCPFLVAREIMSGKTFSPPP